MKEKKKKVKASYLMSAAKQAKTAFLHGLTVKGSMTKKKSLNMQCHYGHGGNLLH